MKKQKVYILFSQHSADTDYEIWSATTNVEAVLSKCSEFDLKDIYDEENDSELTAELIQNSKQIDFGFIDDDRFVLKSFEVALPANTELYAVFANGADEYAWKADLQALCPSKDNAIDFVISKLSEFEDEEQLEEYRERLADSNSMIDSNFTYWNIIRDNLV